MADKIAKQDNERTFLSTIRSNPWMIATFVLGILFVVTLFVKSGPTGTGNVVSEQEVSQNILAYLNSQVEGGVELDSISRDKGLYKLMVTYQGQTIPLYATLDGTSLVSDLVSLDGNAVQQNPNINNGNQRVEIASEKIKGPMLGQATAPVTVIEFSDFQCPFCASAHEDAVKNIRTQYVDTGKVNFVYKDFPLGFHPEAQPAAVAARCFEKVKGGSDAEFFKYHDKLFENQADLGTENYKKWARELGANGVQFDACLSSGEFDDDVQADTDLGSSLGVSGTPAFFIGNEEKGYVLISGAQPFANFKQVIDAQLAGQ